MNKKIDFLPGSARETANLLKRAQNSLRKAPEGYLAVKKKGKSYQYFQVTPDAPQKQVYLKDKKLIRALAQKEYDIRAVRLLSARLRIQRRLESQLRRGELKDLLGTLHPAKQPFVIPLELSDEAYAEAWQAEPYEKLGRPTSGLLLTDRGESVRSKSELIIANRLARAGIPYRYEAPLWLGDHEVHPDFTVLNPRTREEIYWEHQGMMGDPDYLAEALRKYDLYLQNGLLPGRRLLVTQESADSPLDLQTVDALIEGFLI